MDADLAGGILRLVWATTGRWRAFTWAWRWWLVRFDHALMSAFMRSPGPVEVIRALASSLIVSSYAAIRHIFGWQKLIGCGLPPFSALRPCSIAYCSRALIDRRDAARAQVTRDMRDHRTTPYKPVKKMIKALDFATDDGQTNSQCCGSATASCASRSRR